MQHSIIVMALELAAIALLYGTASFWEDRHGHGFASAIRAVSRNVGVWFAMLTASFLMCLLALGFLVALT